MLRDRSLRLHMEEWLKNQEKHDCRERLPHSRRTFHIDIPLDSGPRCRPASANCSQPSSYRLLSCLLDWL